ncbi:unnamed protein product [Paramecium pentaurelia]|uniref:C3H1-type domain-containing protein n=1 Tax=Paramecium pentaurelia TaxID=43138 RepID=A0A8S1XND0_9CILI|nr:unnamed protein product [Paramecium pentaurelia]
MQLRKVRSHENSYTNLDQQRKIDSAQFKTQPCTQQHPSTHKKFCPYYHDESDRRRDPHQFKYKCQICPQFEQCPNGDLCVFSHNKVEQVYHPNRYKSKYCVQNKDCEYGIYCSFAHNEYELRLPLKLEQLVQDKKFWMFHYKTIWCPYIVGHDRASCVYAHNAQDFRRDPQLLQPKECPNWNKTDQISRYDQGGCSDQENCSNCHGWKEYEYHPLIYKTKPCAQPNCIKKECPFFHNDQERRIPKQQNEKQWIIEEPNTQNLLRIPYKSNSNYQGPIIPNYIPQDLNREKMEVGQPLELFSSITTSSNPLSRRGSDFSDRQKKKWNTQRKHHRTAPTTPDQKQQQQTKLPIIKYSRRLQDELWKLSGSDFILHTLEGMKITETNLMHMNEFNLLSLNISDQQKQYLIQALFNIKQEKNYDEKHDDELLKESAGQF